MLFIFNLFIYVFWDRPLLCRVADLKLMIFLLILPSAGILGVYYHAQLSVSKQCPNKILSLCHFCQCTFDCSLLWVGAYAWSHTHTQVWRVRFRPGVTLNEIWPSRLSSRSKTISLEWEDAGSHRKDCKPPAKEETLAKGGPCLCPRYSVG